MTGRTDLEVLEELATRMEKPQNWLDGMDSHDSRESADTGVCWCIGGHLGNAIEGNLLMDTNAFKRFTWEDSGAPEKLAAALVAEGQMRKANVSGWKLLDDPHIEARAVIYAANEDMSHSALLAACKRAVRDEKARTAEPVHLSGPAAKVAR